MDSPNSAEWRGRILSFALTCGLFLNQPSRAAAPVIPPSGLSDLQIEPGFRVELLADESLVNAPAAMAFDESGRLFVVETPRSNNRFTGRIRLLEGTNANGAFDTSRVFADKLSWPSAITTYGGGVFVGATPSIFFLKDSKSRGFADVRKLSFGNYSGTNGMRPAAQANSFNWGLDNCIHGVTGFLEGGPSGAPGAPTDVVGSEFWFDPRALKIFTLNDAARSGLSFDNRGRTFVCDQSHPLLLEMYERRYTDRNPYFELPPRAIPVVAGLAAEPGKIATTPPWLEQGNPFVVYRGGAYPTNYSGNVFIADTEGQAIHRLTCRPNGLEITCTPNPAATDFLVSRDATFRPVQIINGPDGAIYIATRQVADGSGRIYRVVPENFRSSGRPQLGRMKTAALVTAFESPEGWRRDTAARLLYERNDPAAASPLATMASGSKIPQARLQALCALDGLDMLNAEALLRALRDPDATVREHAVLLCEHFARNGDLPDAIWNRIRALTADPSLRVRYQLAFTVGNLFRPDRPAILAAILTQNPDNVWIQTAVLSSLGDGAGDLFLILTRDTKFAATPIGQDFLRRLVVMVGTQGRLAALGSVLNFLDTMSADSPKAYALLRDLGEGLRRQNSSLPLADPQGRMQRFYAEALRIAAASQASDPARIAALKVLGVAPVTYAQTGDLLLLLLGTGQSPEAQAAVVETLGRFSDLRIARAILQRWQALPPSVRSPAVTALLSRSERVPDVMAALEQGTIQAGDLTQLQINYLRHYGDPAISARALQLFGPLAITRPDLMKRFAPAMRLAGSAERGRGVFNARCAICHGPEGYGLGPNLQAARHWSKSRILGAILEPNADREPWLPLVVANTVLGDTYIGLLVNTNDTTITLRLASGEPVILPRSNLQFLQPQPWSLMPEGLENGLTHQNIADLIEYIGQISR